MENSLKGLILAAGVIITCVVVGLGFYIAREAKDTASGGAGKISSLNSEFSETDKTLYDGMTVSGNEVINAIRKFDKEKIGIKVVTGKSTTCYINNISTNENELSGQGATSDLKNASDSKNKNYINPNGKFNGKVLRDANNSIIGIKFSQI